MQPLTFALTLASLTLLGCRTPAEGRWAEVDGGGAEVDGAMSLTLEEGWRGRITGEGIMAGRHLTVSGVRKGRVVLLDLAVEGADSAAFQGGFAGADVIRGYLSTPRLGRALQLVRQ